MIDPGIVGAARESRSVWVDPADVREFARTIGETNPVFFDEWAAAAAGFPSLPLPPTYLFCLATIGDPDPGKFFVDFGVPIERMLHGEQEIRLERPVFAKELLTFSRRIKEISQRGKGRFDVIVEETEVTGATGDLAASLVATFVVPT